MSFECDLAWLGVESVHSNLKTDQADQNCESGIDMNSEASSSSSSLTELEKQEDPFVTKPVITGANYIRPQVSCSSLTDFNKRPTSLDMIVLFRGKVPLLKPVPYDRNARTRVMKMYAKKLQNEPKARYCVMHFDEQSIKVYGIGKPRQLLFEINGRHLDLVKQSKKDVTFFYFTTKSDVLAPYLLPESETEKSGYVCFVFHGTSPRVADRAHRLIQQFVEENCNVQTRPGFFSLISAQANAAAGLPSVQPTTESTLLHTVQKPQANLAAAPVAPKSKPEEKKEIITNPPEVDLLFSLDEPSHPYPAESSVSMFDNLAPPTSVAKSPSSTETDFQLLGDLFSQTAPAPKGNSFAQQHLKYSMQVESALGAYGQPNAKPPQTATANTFLAPSNVTNAMAPSFLSDLKPTQPAPLVPLPAAQTRAPLTPFSMAPPLKPAPNPFSSMKNCNASLSYMNPFGAPVNKAPMAPNAPLGNSLQYSQYSNATYNPFLAASNQSPCRAGVRRMSFGADFDNFLSQTVKDHFKAGDKPDHL